MKRLAIDTTGHTCSVALTIDEYIIERCIDTPKKHAEQILSLIQSLLDESNIAVSELEGIAFGRGPGSFTGLRIAASVAQGLAIANDLPLIPVSSLQALAQGVYRKKGFEKVYAVFDARMQEVYSGAFQYQNGVMKQTEAEVVISPHNLTFEQNKGWVVAGVGWEAYQSIFQGQRAGLVDVLPDMEPLAYDVLVLSETLPSVSYDEAVPVYLRDNVTRS
jgi:tRNA threonylcarbamoyladenosine biosynthesis protein TsaB